VLLLLFLHGSGPTPPVPFFFSAQYASGWTLRITRQWHLLQLEICTACARVEMRLLLGLGHYTVYDKMLAWASVCALQPVDQIRPESLLRQLCTRHGLFNPTAAALKHNSQSREEMTTTQS
jgi:hypothetical protein